MTLNPWIGLKVALILTLLPAVSIIMADLAVIMSLGGVKPYAYGRVYLEALIEEARRLKSLGDKRSERRFRKLKPEIDMLRGRMSKVQLIRLMLILFFYVTTVLLVYQRYPVVLPVEPCIPLITVTVKGVCLMPSPILIVLGYLLWIPLVEEPVFALRVYRRLAMGRVEGSPRAEAGLPVEESKEG